ncbi:diguanylate cyclase [Aliivibrio fischeri]|uniref:TackOD1 domain-containing metal-binding protein n=1 Tax=Aliivibrio fischeri TaxID=668 RepID=UPI0012D91A38|nr:diguanylate cyclase [Aliivibrio fischeri]MUK62837.1 diguanylate cyclase [Aliivibrio fischeri]MUL22263.1 diguanylate cyclase [Aliivibrio fischeri]MUL26054.1 diguanylate cyclase [Aliivibrio fischeri]
MKMESSVSIPVYVIGESKSVYGSDINIIHVKSADALLLHEPAICIVSLPPEEQDRTLEYLHSKLQLWNWHIYVLKASKLSSHLSDGIWTPTNVAEQWMLHKAKLALIKEEPLDKLLAWLWLGTERCLKPLCDSSKQELYHYPLITAYIGYKNASNNYLQLETKRGFLKKEYTVDRVRLCPSCNSGHQNYIETCPSCKSVDIEEIVSLHCFTCGHVGKQDHFMQRGKLECPTCLTQLRHIGVDYDRPLESYKCLDCDYSFSESVARVRCLSCTDSNEIDDLITRHISTYKAGDQVKNLMMYGHQSFHQELTLKGLIDEDSFDNLLVWINKLAIRHQHSHILLGIKLAGIEEYSAQFGETKLMQLIDQISNDLNSILRDTDICCQYRSDMILLLMPMTPIDSLPVLQKKIELIAEKIESELVLLNVHIWSLPNVSLQDDAAKWLVDELGTIE